MATKYLVLLVDLTHKLLGLGSRYMHLPFRQVQIQFPEDMFVIDKYSTLKS